MKPAEIAAEIAKDHDMPAGEAKRIVVQISKMIIDAAQKGEDVTLPGLGTFKVKTQPAGKKLAFTNSKQLKQVLNPGV